MRTLYEFEKYGTNPECRDTDLDGIDDLDELDGDIGTTSVTDPGSPDSDEDGLLDGYDRRMGGVLYYGELSTHWSNDLPTDPLDGDCDGDGLPMGGRSTAGRP